MIDPNRNTSEDVLRRLKEASYERMRVELKCSIELLMRDFDMDWDDVGRLLEIRHVGSRAVMTKQNVIQGYLSLSTLNALAHVFSCEPYIIFRPRLPWVAT